MFGLERDALWWRVIEVKYGREWGGWCSNLVFGSHGLWMYIRRGWPTLSSYLQYEIGDGLRVKSW